MFTVLTHCTSGQKAPSPQTAKTMRTKLVTTSLASLTVCLLILSSEVSGQQTVEVSGVTAQTVWQDLRSRQTITFSVVRDTAQFLVVNLAWITAGLLLWRGPALTGQERQEEEVTFLQDRLSLSTQTVDASRLNNFFMNPNKVARNMFVSASLVSRSESQVIPRKLQLIYFSS